MRIVIVLVLIIAGVAGIGLYRGWFHISSDRGADQSNVTLDGIGVDRTKACAGPVRIVGSVTDSAKGGSDPVQSGVITPDCS